MKRKNTTRNALFTSIISLLLCVSMLVGTTFAWFTDSVVSGNNVIAAGNLDIELYHDGDKKVDSSTNLFNDVLWEPGVVIYENFTIKNEGNLALLYDFAMNWGDYNTLAGQYNLTQVLKVAKIDGHVSGSREAAIAAGEGKWAALDSWSFSGEMTTKGETKDFALIIYWEPSDNDNNWNVQNGKTLDKGEYLYVNLGINLQATQKMHEEDSFGKDYDSLANPWDGSVGEVPEAEENVITLTTAAELAAFAKAVNEGTTYSGKTVKLGANINLDNQPWTAIGDCESGKYFQGTFDGQGYTIYNLNVDYSTDASEHATAGLFGWVDAAGATVKNMKLENATVLGSHWVGAIAGYWTGRIENCSVNNSTIMGFNVNSEANGDKVGGIVGCLNEHSYINGNTVTNTEITGNRDIGGIAGSVAASTYEMKNNQVADTKLCYSEEKSYASAGKIVSGRTGYVPNDTNTATNVTIVRVINVKTVAELNAALAALSGDALNTAAILQNCNEPSGVVQIPAAYTGTLTLKDSTIASVQAVNAANIVIAGDVKVDASALEDTSAITGVTLNISGNGNLTAVGKGKAAFGIGGMTTESITITNVTVDYVAGGYAGYVADTVNDKYLKNPPEGGAAIGSGKDGAVITLNNVNVVKAIGGSKAAAIGARYWTGVTVNITNSTIGYAEGGASAAGIGGSRVSGNATESGTTINITNSTVTAKGGAYGAGIGSGYDTHCLSEQPLCTINIDGSTINATGGQYAAGVGTGYHNAALAGEIKNSTVDAVSGEKFYKATYTQAQDIGFGVTDPAREGKQTGSKLIYNGTEIGIPGITVENADALVKALQNGGNVTLVGTIDMNGGTVEIPNGTTISGGTVENALLTVADDSGATFKGVTFSDTVSVEAKGDGSLSFVDCEFNVHPQKLNGFSRGAAIIGANQYYELDLHLENCTFNYQYETGDADLWNAAIFMWSNVDDCVIKNCTFNDYGFVAVKLMNVAEGAEIVLDGNTFNMCEASAANYFNNDAVQIMPQHDNAFSVVCTNNTFNGAYDQNTVVDIEGMSGLTLTKYTLTQSGNTINGVAATDVNFEIQ